MILAGLHRVLMVASLLVPAGLFAAAAVQNRADVMREGEQDLVRTASVMDEHARKVFETGELVLAHVDDHVSRMSWEQIAAPETSAFLARLKASLDQVVSIWIADASGTVRAGSQDWNPAVGIGEREFFQAQRGRDRGAYVSGAFRGKATETASFAISRRRVTPDGRFDGTIHISLSPEYFARTYRAIIPEAQHVASLMRADGEILARDPSRAVGAQLYPVTSPLMQQIQHQPAGGFAIGASSLDGIDRAFAYRKVGNYPVYVALGVPVSVLADQWYENLKLYGAAAAAAAVMLLLASGLAFRGMQAERATLAKLHAALDDLRHETAQREAAEQRVRQAEKMEAVGQLTGGIAHDFNNLLTAVLGSLQLLRKRLPPADRRASRLLDNAVRGAERGAELTQRLLAFSRGQVLKPQAVSLPALVEDMKPLLRSSLGAGVELVTRFPPAPPPARADANQLELAILNLALNARDAMPGGGRLEIAGRSELVNGTNEAELRPGAYLVLSVADTGEGMDGATLAHCVEPFYTTKGIGKGTGLGLSMVHGLAAQSGGRLVIISRKDEGTTAEIWLPEAGADELAELPPLEARREVRPSSGRVLLVDDDTLVLSTAAPMLEDLGYEVVTAGSGREAVELVRSGRAVDLVITDQVMPGLTGVDTAAALRALRPGLPVLLATGYAERSELAASGLPLLEKPFDQAGLADAIERLGLHHGADAA